MSTLAAEPVAQQQSQQSQRPPRPGRRPLRWVGAAGLVGVGVLLLMFAPWWRGVEASLSAPAVHLATGERTQAIAATSTVVLYRGPRAVAAFLLTGECSVGSLLAGLAIVGAPLLLTRLEGWRPPAAVALAATILLVVNVARVAAVGAAVDAWGTGGGFTFSHTYLGSTMSFIGTCLAGAAFAGALVYRRRSDRHASPVT